MGEIANYLSMGKYNIFVWPAFAFAITVLLGLGLSGWRRWRGIQKALRHSTL